MAADGTRIADDNVENTSTSAQKTGEKALNAVKAAGSMSQKTAVIDTEVNKFLTQIRNDT